MTDPIVPRYFAASNSSGGFCSYYADCFSEHRCDHLYIIKGGPGTGKSHFMRVVARRAQKEGYCVTAYDCSSDPSSLDGILLRREGYPTLGLLDGTAPHVWEPSSPGVREELVDLGAFWNADQLIGQGETIRALTDSKKNAYDRAYAYLHAAGELDRIADRLLDCAVQRKRLQALAARLLRGVPAGDTFDAIPALRRAVSMTGRACHHSFEAMADGLVVIDDHYGLGARLTELLLTLSRDRRLTVLVSYDPVYTHKIDGLYYPATGLAILVGHSEARESCPTRSISLRRYMEPIALRDVRGEVRHAMALRSRLEEDALHSLAVAARHHFELETIYAAAMDFRAKEAYTEQFCQRLFG